MLEGLSMLAHPKSLEYCQPHSEHPYSAHCCCDHCWLQSFGSLLSVCEWWHFLQPGKKTAHSHNAAVPMSAFISCWCCVISVMWKLWWVCDSSRYGLDQRQCSWHWILRLKWKSDFFCIFFNACFLIGFSLYIKKNPNLLILKIRWHKERERRQQGRSLLAHCPDGYSG